MSHWKIRHFDPTLGEDHKAFSLFLRCLNMSTEMTMYSTPLMKLEYWKALLLHLVLSLQSQRVFLLWESEAEGWCNFCVWHFTGWRAEPWIEFRSLQCDPALYLSLLLERFWWPSCKQIWGQTNFTLLVYVLHTTTINAFFFQLMKASALASCCYVTILSSNGRFAVILVGNAAFIECLLQIPCCNGELGSMGNMLNRYKRRNQTSWETL